MLYQLKVARLEPLQPVRPGRRLGLFTHLGSSIALVVGFFGLIGAGASLTLYAAWIRAVGAIRRLTPSGRSGTSLYDGASSSSSAGCLRARNRNRRLTAGHQEAMSSISTGIRP